MEDSDELGTQTYNMRLAIAYNTFYKRLRPIIAKANIIVMAINHIKDKPEMAFQKTQAQIQYMKRMRISLVVQVQSIILKTYSVSFTKVNIHLKKMGLKAS